MLESIERPRVLPYTRSEPHGSTRHQRSHARLIRRPGAGAATRRAWRLDAAPFGVALLWTLVTTTALLLWGLTGHRELLDACRSDAALSSTAGLEALALLAASVRRLMR